MWNLGHQQDHLWGKGTVWTHGPVCTVRKVCSQADVREVTALRAGDVDLESSLGRRWLRVSWVQYEALWVIHLKADVHLWRVPIYVGGVGAVSVGDKSK